MKRLQEWFSGQGGNKNSNDQELEAIPMSNGDLDNFAQVLSLLMRRQDRLEKSLFALSQQVRANLLAHLDPELPRLSNEQLQRLGVARALIEPLATNPRFSMDVARVRQWSTGCHCVDPKGECSCAELQLAMANVELLDPSIDYLGYKIVFFCRHPDGRGKFEGVCALLHLQLPGKSARIYTSEAKNACRHGVVEVKPAHDGLHAAQKYNTNCCVVIGVQFFGLPKPTKQALIAYAKNRGFLVSGFGGSSKMRYELGQLHIEPRAGQIRNNQRCTEGLHFFVDPESAFAYGYGEWTRGSPASFLGVVTMRLSQPRGLVFAIEDKAMDGKHHLDAHQGWMARAEPIEKSADLVPTRFAAMESYLLNMVDQAKAKT